MRRMNRTFSTLAAAGAVLVGVAACGRGGDSGSVETAAPPAAAPQEETAGGAAAQPAASEPAPAREQETPAPPVVRESAESPYGFYTIQVSAWRSESKARRQAQLYRDRGLEAYVQRAEVPDLGTWYRVRVGRYQSLTEARRAAASLRDIPADETWVDNFREGTLPPP